MALKKDRLEKSKKKNHIPPKNTNLPKLDTYTGIPQRDCGFGFRPLQKSEYCNKQDQIKFLVPQGTEIMSTLYCSLLSVLYHYV